MLRGRCSYTRVMFTILSVFTYKHWVDVALPLIGSGLLMLNGCAWVAVLKLVIAPVIRHHVVPFTSRKSLAAAHSLAE